MNKNDFYLKGWCRFDYDSKLASWVRYALPFARESVTSPENQYWLRCGGTWFAGVNALPNLDDGSLKGGPALECKAVDYVYNELDVTGFDWDAAQVSVCYPGYPQPMESETPAAFRYRQERDAAHVDGLLPEGPDRRRYLREYHGFILGIPMVEYDPGASPLVVWEGSQEIVREEFKRYFDGLAPEQWGDLDVTEFYLELRYLIFKRCERIEIPARPGEAYLIHRLALHGMSPWREGASATVDGRMICYFRPQTSGPEGWLFNP